MITEHHKTKFIDLKGPTLIVPHATDGGVYTSDQILNPFYRNVSGFNDFLQDNKNKKLVEMPKFTKSEANMLLFASREQYTYKPNRDKVIASFKSLKERLELKPEACIAIPIFGEDDPRFNGLNSAGSAKITREEVAQIAREILGDVNGFINLIFEPVVEGATSS